ncbi:MAG: hypothetical protein RLZ59_295 [Pseudomonadota bacterium]
MPGQRPLMSVIMCVFNAQDHLESAIWSIRNQTFRDFEFLILDDGSTDGTANIIHRHAAEDTRLRVIHQPNRGVVASLNLLIESAQSDLLARMDGDDIAAPNRLSLQVQAMKGAPDIVALGSWARLIDAAGRPTGRTTSPPSHHDHIRLALGANKPALLHSSVMMRTDAVQRVGGYRAAFQHCEDLDLWWRLLRVGRLANLPMPLIDYRLTPNQISQKHRIEQATNAAIAGHVHRLIAAGQDDPIDGALPLPPLDAIGQQLNAPNFAQAIRAEIVPQILYATASLAASDLKLIAAHLAETRAVAWVPLWKATARLILAGHWRAALRLAMLLSGRAFRR